MGESANKLTTPKLIASWICVCDSQVNSEPINSAGLNLSLLLLNFCAHQLFSSYTTFETKNSKLLDKKIKIVNSRFLLKNGCKLFTIN